MKRIPLLILILFPIFAVSCRLNLPEKQRIKAEINQIRSVTAVRVTAEEKMFTMSATARLLPVDSFSISAPPGASIQNVYVEEGQRIAQGQNLIQFMGDDFDARLELSRAEQREAEAAIADYNYQIQNKEKLLEEEKLSEVVAGGLDEKLAHARATAERAKAEIAYYDKRDTPNPLINAPFDGLITKRNAAPGATPKAGDLLLELVKLDPMRLVFEIPYELVDSITRDVPVSASFASMAGREFHAQIQMIGPDIDESKQTIEIKALLPNAEELLKPGLTAKVTLKTDRRTRLLKIPPQAVWQERGHDYVFRVNGDRLQQVSVETLDDGSGTLQVLRGLKENDLVVSSDRDELHDNSLVKIEIVDESY